MLMLSDAQRGQRGQPTKQTGVEMQRVARPPSLTMAPSRSTLDAHIVHYWMCCCVASGYKVEAGWVQSSE
jgi:hypothetical protein